MLLLKPLSHSFSHESLVIILLIIDELLVKMYFLRKYVLTRIDESLQAIFIVNEWDIWASIRFVRNCLSKTLGGHLNRQFSWSMQK